MNAPDNIPRRIVKKSFIGGRCRTRRGSNHYPSAPSCIARNFAYHRRVLSSSISKSNSSRASTVQRQSRAELQLIMSGIEALGFACCIFQVITFARDTAQLCQDIYNGQKHPDSHLEDVAKAMREAADQVKTSCSAANGPLEGRLAEIAKNCIPVAEQLEAQVQAIQKHVNKGSSLGLVRARFRSYKKRKTIDDLERQLGGYTDAMEHLMTTELL